MKDCGCKWDGNLDGKIRRCALHAKAYKAERANRNGAAEIAYLKSVLKQIRQHSRPVRYIVELAEQKYAK